MKGKKTLKLKVIDCFYLFLSISSVKNSWIGLFTIIFKVKQNFRNGLKFWNGEISSKISKKKNLKIEFSNKNSGFCQNFAMEQNLQFDKDDIEPRNWTCHFLSSMKFYNFWKISKFDFLSFFFIYFKLKFSSQNFWTISIFSQIFENFPILIFCIDSQNSVSKSLSKFLKNYRLGWLKPFSFQNWLVKFHLARRWTVLYFFVSKRNCRRSEW